MILVTGATGNTGSCVVRALRERGAHVRAFVRDADKAHRLLGDEVDLALGDFADPRSGRTALDGVDTLFLSGADDPRRVEWEVGAIDAASAAGVRRIVKLSSIAASPRVPVAFWAWHGRIERHLRESGVPAVVLRAGYFMSNLLAAAGEVVREGHLAAPAGEARIAMVDPRDVGACAAVALTAAGHDGRTYVLTGPRALTYADVARELSAVAGRDVAYVDVPDQVARRRIVDAGASDTFAGQVVAVFAALRTGVGERVTDAVETLTGASRSTTSSPRAIASRSAGRCTARTPGRCSAAHLPGDP
jgi:uncharacterized protein YbjT (DUF2867 family)